MSKINFSKPVLSSFLSAVTLSKNKEIQNIEALFNIQKTSIQSIIVSSDRTLAVRGTLKGAFEEIGSVGVTDLVSFEKFVESMDDAFSGDFQKNKLVLQSKNHKISVVLQNAEYIQNKLEKEKFENILTQANSGFSFTLTSENIKELISKFKTLSSQDLVLEGKDGKISLYIKDYKTESELYSTFECDSLNKNTFSIQVAKHLVYLLETLGSDVTIKLGKEENRNAIGIFSETEDYQIEYLLALKVKTVEPTTTSTESSSTKSKKVKKSETPVEA